jgi:hypothetical protein
MYTGYDYEEYCCEYLKKQRYRHISQTPKSGDHGVDIIAVKHGKNMLFSANITRPRLVTRLFRRRTQGAASMTVTCLLLSQIQRLRRMR